MALLLSLALVFTIVYRLGAGLHGLGRRGLIIVAIGLAVLFATLAYAELLRRYGAQSVVSSILDFAEALREGRRPLTDARDNVRSLAMVFGAIRSAEAGAPVPVEGDPVPVEGDPVPVEGATPERTPA